ncbi:MULTISPECIES: HalOD1 output domain-containing protein [Halorussus]|uniref:HalOD1 output domain-containing protein n=1 Tax=Halorussus TaxID=1070314 RepID=UPI000E21B1CF|nr:MULTISPECIES: HalOD1 output domain-containing protein [Halorussus]NHN57493.1 hypothetical protein [Halorussus sp. JP-T4]
MGSTFENETGATDGAATHRVEHDWASDDELSETIVSAVASVLETDPTDLSPLYEVIDPDALNRLYAPTPNAHVRPGGGRLTFSYNGCLVTAYWDGAVEIEPPVDRD